MTTQTEWIAAAEAARRLGVTKRRIHQILIAKRLRIKQTPLGRLIDAESVEEYRKRRDEILAS